MEGAVRDVGDQTQFVERGLLDHLTARVAQLGLDRHRRPIVDPDAIAVAETIAWHERYEVRDATLLAYTLDRLQFIGLGGARIELRQGVQHAAGAGPSLHQHDALVRQEAEKLSPPADELAARSVQRHDTLSDLAVPDTMDDAQRLGAPVAIMPQGADVVALRERLVHAVQQSLCIGVRGDGRSGARRLGMHDSAETRASEPRQEVQTAHRSAHRSALAAGGGGGSWPGAGASISSYRASGSATRDDSALRRSKGAATSLWATTKFAMAAPPIRTAGALEGGGTV